MNELVAAAKAEFDRAKARMVNALNSTPDEKINWSPSPTSRTPVEIVVHSALGTSGLQGWIAAGMPAEGFDPVAIDAGSREAESKVKTREEAFAMLDDASTKFHGWLDSLTEDDLAKVHQSPFGPFPMTAAMTIPADHIRGHVAQIDYIQTIHGDHTWR
ncbi:MAG: DinB family protein [Armatimonadetes bacterium]|nr:DinB family protein [Armatimonadota bacterium]